MKSLLSIPSQSFLDTYSRIRKLLKGNDLYIFQSMETISRNLSTSFSLPSDPSEYEVKHREIESKLRYIKTLGCDNGLKLFSEIANQALIAGGIPGVNTVDLINSLVFDSEYDNLKLIISKERRFVAEWTVLINSLGAHVPIKIYLDLYDHNIAEIVPEYLVEYIHGSIVSFQQKLYAVSSALITIAMEATLRDVLKKKGYTYETRGNNTDVFAFVPAKIYPDTDEYRIKFTNPMPRISSEFLQSTGGSTSINVRIKRSKRPNGQYELIIRDCNSLLDHFSSQTVETPAQKSISGLGAALQIARRDEGILTPDLLPEDVDNIIKFVRNNLIHLSGNSFESQTSEGVLVLRDFINDQDRVFELVRNIPHFINKQYQILHG